MYFHGFARNEGGSPEVQGGSKKCRGGCQTSRGIRICSVSARGSQKGAQSHTQLCTQPSACSTRMYVSGSIDYRYRGAPRARGAPELEPLLVRTMMIMCTFFVFVDMHNQLCGIDVILCTVSVGAIALVLVHVYSADAAGDCSCSCVHAHVTMHLVPVCIDCSSSA